MVKESARGYKHPSFVIIFYYFYFSNLTAMIIAVRLFGMSTAGKTFSLPNESYSNYPYNNRRVVESGRGNFILDDSACGRETCVKREIV